MRKFRKIAVVAVSAMTLLSFTACGGKKESTAPTIAQPAQGTSIDGTGYTLTYPDTWMDGKEAASYSAAAKADLILYSQEGAGDDTFAENINVVQGDAGKNAKIDDYIDQVKKQYQSSSAYNLVEEPQKCSVNGIDAYKLVTEVKQSGVTYKCKQVCLIANDKAYVITYSGDVNGGYDGKESEADSIMASFKLK